MKKVFYDLETTGTKAHKNSIHQIAGIMEIDGRVVETFDIKTAPHPQAIIEPKALKIAGVTEEQVRAYQPMKKAYLEFRGIMLKYIDPYNPKDKAHLIGFNNRGFDDPFLWRWFEQNGDNYFGSWFYIGLDTMALAAQYLINRRINMASFKLKSVAVELGIEIDETKLHNAIYDVQLTREIYRIVTGLRVEL